MLLEHLCATSSEYYSPGYSCSSCVVHSYESTYSSTYDPRYSERAVQVYWYVIQGLCSLSSLLPGIITVVVYAATATSFITHPRTRPSFSAYATLPIRDRVNREGVPLRMQSAVAVDTIEQAQSIILSAAESRDQDPDTIIEAIRYIVGIGMMYKLMRNTPS